MANKQPRQIVKERLSPNRLLVRLRPSNNWLYPAILVAVAVVSHIIWFIPGSVLFHGDWFHWTDTAAKQAWVGLGAWNSFFGIGTPRILIGFSLMQDIWSLIMHFGASFDTAVRYTLMAPIAILGFIAPYIFVRRLVSDNLVAFVVALFYGSTTYFLIRQGSHLPIAFVYAFSPIIFTLFARAIDTLHRRDWAWFALAYSLGLCYEVRIMYILSAVLLIYAAFFFPWRTPRAALPGIGVAALIITGLSSFWLLPTVFGGAGSTISQVTARGLFGSDLFDLQHALALSASGWTGGAPNESFIMQPVRGYLWVIPLLTLLPLLLFDRMPLRRRKQVLFFVVISLLGIFLTKQAAAPAPAVYQWLYSNLPGFSLFREASKFYPITAWGYLGLISLGLVELRKSKLRFLAIPPALAIAGVAFINLAPLATGTFGTLFAARHIPPDYQVLNRKISSEPGIFRTLWVPFHSQWSYFDMTHPTANAVPGGEQGWLPAIPGAGLPVDLQMLETFTRPYVQTLTNMSTIKYVVVPIRDTVNDDDFIKYYGDNLHFYTDMLAKVPWLKRVDVGTKQAVVFQNDKYTPYVSSLSGIYAMPADQNLDNSYSFITQALGKNFQYVSGNLAGSPHASKLIDIFGDVQTAKITGHTVTRQLPLTGGSTLYTNTNRPSYSYTITDNVLSLEATYANNLTAGPTKLVQQTDTKPVGRTSIQPGRNYYLADGYDLTPMKTAPVSRELGFSSKPLQIVSTGGDNLLPNPSFEKGLWQQHVEDCNNYDNQSMISMKLNQSNHTDGKRALELGAFRHTACTVSAPVPVTAGQSYAFNFDYDTQIARELSYWLEFDDPAHTVTKQYLPVPNQDWHSYYHSFTVPPGAKTVRIRLLGMPDDRRQAYAKTFYDNMSLSRLNIDIDPKLDLTPKFQPTPLKGSGNRSVQLALYDPSISGDNLVTNGSFEDGAWEKEVGDCDAYDNRPELSMAVDSKAKTDGGHSLELLAKRHVACTTQHHIPIKENAAYLVSFDYQSYNATAAAYYMQFNDPQGTIITQQLPIKGRGWQHFSKTIKAPIDASEVNLSLYAYPDNYGAQYIGNRYDNVRIVRIPDADGGYYVLDQPGQTPATPAKIDYTSVVPTKKLVHIKGATAPFYVAMSEAYSPKWRLEINNHQVTGPIGSWVPWTGANEVPADDHFKLDNFINGWYVDVNKLCGKQHLCKPNSDGSYDMEMVAEFTPQRWFYLGGVISGLTLLGALLYLSPVWSTVLNLRRADDGNSGEAASPGSPRTPPASPGRPESKPAISVAQKPKKKVVRLG